MKKIGKNKLWIVAVAMVVVVLIGLYVPLPSNHEQTLKGFIYQCNEDGKVTSMIPVDEIAVEVDVNRQQYLLNDSKTLEGRIVFSNYIKTANDGGPLPVEDVAFAVESQYVRCYGEALAVGESVEYRAIEKVSEGDRYRSCTDMFYEDEDAYYTTIVYEKQEEMPIYREMRYSKNFDRLMWIDYHNQYVYICAEKAESSDVMLGYFPEARVE